MFLEQFNKENSKQGWIEVICGSMFSGKTEELIRRSVILAKEEYNCRVGQRIIVTGGFPIGTQTNSFRINKKI